MHTDGITDRNKQNEVYFNVLSINIRNFNQSYILSNDNATSATWLSVALRHLTCRHSDIKTKRSDRCGIYRVIS